MRRKPGFLHLPSLVTGVLVTFAVAIFVGRVFGHRPSLNDGWRQPVNAKHTSVDDHYKNEANFKCHDGDFKANGTGIPLMNFSGFSDWDNDRRPIIMCKHGVSERVFIESSIPMIELQTFTPCSLFQQIRGRTLWFLGDSQQTAFWLATKFFLRQYMVSPLDVHGTLPSQGAIADILRDAYDILCVQLIDGTRVCRLPIMKGGGWRLQFVFEFLNRNYPNFAHDIVIFNYGLHYNVGVNSTLPHDLANFGVYRKAIKRSGSWNMPLTIWIDTLAQHFSTSGGTYSEGAGLENDTCRPTSAPGIGPYNTLAAPFIEQISDAHLQTWELTVPFHYAHRRPGDCTHYCHPGVPELLILQLYRLLSTRPSVM
jgi:hypothetical protein